MIVFREPKPDQPYVSLAYCGEELVAARIGGHGPSAWDVISGWVPEDREYALRVALEDAYEFSGRLNAFFQ